MAAGTTKEVTFEAVNGPIDDRVDEAYTAKYRVQSFFGVSCFSWPGTHMTQRRAVLFLLLKSWGLWSAAQLRRSRTSRRRDRKLDAK